MARMFEGVNAGTILAKRRHGIEMFIDTCDAPRAAAGGNKFFLAIAKPQKIVINLQRLCSWTSDTKRRRAKVRHTFSATALRRYKQGTQPMPWSTETSVRELLECGSQVHPDVNILLLCGVLDDGVNGPSVLGGITRTIQMSHRQAGRCGK
jgi:hypothetical protein